VCVCVCVCACVCECVCLCVCACVCVCFVTSFDISKVEKVFAKPVLSFTKDTSGILGT
jgi:hypothetical protein